MLSEIGIELLSAGFISLVRHLWQALNQEENDDGFFPAELVEMSEDEYQAFVSRYSRNWECN